LKLRELKSHYRLLGACTSCHLVGSDLEHSAIEIKDLKHKLTHSSRYNVLSLLCKTCGSLKGKLFYAIKENTELQQEVAYLTARLEKTCFEQEND
jgi:5-methylcytosine-specific restriction endonuclease McrA